MIKTDILALGWPQGDRDHHILIPVCVELEQKYNLKVQYGNMFNGLFLLLFCQPKMLLVSNFLGAKINHEITKYAFEKGIKVVSLISEGNVPDGNPEPYLWGHNSEGKLFLDLFLLWSDFTRGSFARIVPQHADILKVGGATGIDRYKLLSRLTQKDFFKKENIDGFKKVVGVAAWGFDLFCDERYFKRHQKMMRKQGDDEQAAIHQESKGILKGIYRQLIETNPDTLFILRYHPGVVSEEHTEFYGLDDYRNVYVSKPSKGCLYDVSDIISFSDIWISYESMTALEAWLLEKPTYLINPVSKNFYRELTHAGSPIVATYEEAQSNLEEFFSTNKLQSFEDIKEKREGVVAEIIGWGDGKNHQRSAKEINDVFEVSDLRTKKNYLPPKLLIKSQVGYWFSFIPFLCNKFNLKRMKFRNMKELFSIYKKSISNI